MFKITELENSCEPRYILQNIEALKGSSKLEYLTDTMKRCIVSPAKKKKRQLSGYNCFVRVMSKRGNKSVIKSRAWSTLEPAKKETWNRTAKQGCDNPRLWEEKL